MTLAGGGEGGGEESSGVRERKKKEREREIGERGGEKNRCSVAKRGRSKGSSQRPPRFGPSRLGISCEFLLSLSREEEEEEEEEKEVPTEEVIFGGGGGGVRREGGNSSQSDAIRNGTEKILSEKEKPKDQKKKHFCSFFFP